LFPLKLSCASTGTQMLSLAHMGLSRAWSRAPFATDLDGASSEQYCTFLRHTSLVNFGLSVFARFLFPLCRDDNVLCADNALLASRGSDFSYAAKVPK